MKRIVLSLCAAAAFGMATQAEATTYRWTWDGVTGPVSHDGGRIKAASSSYDNGTQDFGFSVTLGKRAADNQNSQGYWLAVSNGPNPKGSAGELAIFYFDASRSTPVLTAYGYNGQNGFTSFMDGSPAAGTQTPDRIATSKLNSSWIQNLAVNTNSDGSRTMSFNIHGAVINNYNPVNQGPNAWKGVAYGESLGLWMHPVTQLTTSYNQAGFLKSFNFCNSGWLDLNDQHTESVPEPASMAALALGCVGLIRKRFKA